jgi:hypothetical protein
MSISANTINITTGSFKNITTTYVGGAGIATPTDVTTGTSKVLIVTPASLQNLLASAGAIGKNSASTGTFGTVTASSLSGTGMADSKTILAGTNNTKAINPAGVKLALSNPPAIGSTTANSAQFTNVSANSIDASSSALPVLADINGSLSGTYTPDYSWSVAGSAQISTSVKKFGSASAALLNSGDYIQTTLTPPSGAWTIEFWFNVADYGGGVNTLIGNSNEYLIAVQYNPSNGLVSVFLSSNGTGWDIVLFDSSDNSASASTWNHLALQYDGFNYDLYLNGLKTPLATNNYTKVNDSMWSTLRFGDWGWTSDYMNGYLDELRISNIARYDSNFTPSTIEFVRDINTLVHNHFNGSDGSTNFNATEVTALLGFTSNKVLTPYSFINMLRSPPIIGSITPNTGVFTNFTVSGALNLNNPLRTIYGGLERSSYQKGDILVGGGGSTLNVLPVGGASNYYLRSDSHSTYGVDWQTPSNSINNTTKILFASNTDSVNSTVTTKALVPSNIPYFTARPYALGSTSEANANLGTVTVLNGLTLANAISIGIGGTGLSSFSAGDLMVGNSSNTLSKLAVGTKGQYLKTDSTATHGIAWSSVSVNANNSSTTIINYNFISKPRKLSSTSWIFDSISVTDDIGTSFTKTSVAIDTSPSNVNLTGGIMQSANNLSGTISLSRTNPYVITGTGTSFTSTFQVGDIIYITGGSYNTGRLITAINSDTSLTIDTPITSLTPNTWTSKMTVAQPYVGGQDCYRTNNQKFGIGSLFTNGNDLQTQVTFGSNVQPQNWTYEMWYTHNNGAWVNMFFQLPPFAYIGRQFGFGAQLTYTLNNGNGTNLVTAGNYNPNFAVSGTWAHLAFCYDGSKYYIYLNGTQIYSSSAGQPNLPPSALQTVVFGSVGGISGEQVNVDEFRFSNICRYTTAFTAPTDRFTWDSNTISLQHFDNIDFNMTDEANFAHASGLTFKRGGYYSNARYNIYGYAQQDVPGVLMLSTRSTKKGQTIVDVPTSIAAFDRVLIPYQVDVCNDVVTIVMNNTQDVPADYIDIGYPKVINKYQYSIPYTSARNILNSDNLEIKGPKTLDPQKSGAYGILSGTISGGLSNINSTTVTGVNTKFTSDLRAGDVLTINGQQRQVSSITNDTTLTVNSAYTAVPTWTGKDNNTVGTITSPSNSNTLYLSNAFSYASINTCYISGLTPPSGSWTIEAWVYVINDNSSQFGLLSDWLNMNCLSVYFSGTTVAIRLNTNANTNATSGTWEYAASTSSGTFSYNTWTHLAIQFDGSTYKTIINGAYTSGLSYSSTNSILPGIWSYFHVGYASGGYNFEGYIDSFRISNVARYSGNFSPSSTFSNDGSTICLNNFNSNISLSASELINGVIWSDNCPGYSTKMSRFGSSSLHFKGNKDNNIGCTPHMYTSASGLTTPTDSWTIELWFNLASIYKDYNCLIGNYNDNILKVGVNSGGYLTTYILLSNGTILANNVIGTTKVSLATWYHLALVFTGYSYDLYLNGTLEQTFSSELPIDIRAFMQLMFGNIVGNSNWNLIDAYIDEIRVSDIARYTGTFSPSASAFTRDTNTLILNHFNIPDQSIALSTSDESISVNVPTIEPFVYGPSNNAMYSTQNPVLTSWIDRSGVNNSSTIVNASKMTYSTQVNSKTALTLTGSNSGYVTINGPGSAVTTYTAVIVLKMAATTNNSFFFITSNWTTGGVQFYLNGTSNWAYNVNGGGTASGGSNLSTGTVYIATITDTIANLNIWVNGSQIITNNTGSASVVSRKLDVVSIGGWSGDSSRGFNGQICEVQFYNTALSGTDRQKVEYYLGQKWGVSGLTTPGSPLPGSPANTDFPTGLTDWFDAADSNTFVLSPLKKFGTSSLFLNSGYQQIINLPYPSGPWTIECWLYPITVGGYNTLLTGFDSAGNRYFVVQYDGNTGNQLNAGLPGPGTINNVGTTPVGTWSHFALVFTGSQYIMFANGSNVGSLNTSTLTSPQMWTYFYLGSPSEKWNGYIDEFRISNIARYTSSFTVPSSPFTKDSNTLVLNHFEPSYTVPYDATIYKYTNNWNGFGQGYQPSQPKYFSSGGYLNGHYVSFNRAYSHFLNGGSHQSLAPGDLFFCSSQSKISFISAHAVLYRWLVYSL